MLCVQPTYDKLLAEVPKYKLITQSVLSDRLRVSSRIQLLVGLRGSRERLNDFHCFIQWGMGQHVCRCWRVLMHLLGTCTQAIP